MRPIAFFFIAFRPLDCFVDFFALDLVFEGDVVWLKLDLMV